MIYGIQKLSLVDYKGLPSFVIFLGGCNFRCPFCHNKGIVEKEFPTVAEEEVVAMLEARKNFIGAVVVTGGEPTIYGKKLISFLKRLRTTGLKIKLDTNGTNPSFLREIIEQKLVDYIAMDLKGTWSRYSEIVGATISLQPIKESIVLIEESGIAYEFRTTVCKEFHTESDLKEMQGYLKKGSPYYLQPYQYSDNQIQNVHYTSYSKEELKQFENDLNLVVKQ